MTAQNNFLQVSDWTHCLRCHTDIVRESLAKHVFSDCPDKDQEAHRKSNCPRCMEFEQQSNPWWPRRGPARL